VWAFFGFIKPAYTEVSNLQIQKKEYEQAIANANEVIFLRGKLLAARDSISEENWARLSKLLPDNFNSEKLLYDMNNLALSNAINLESFKIEIENNAQNQSTQPSPNPQIAPGVAVQRYSSANLSVNFESTYTDFNIFLEKLEQSLKLFDVVSIGIKPIRSEDDFNRYAFDIKLTTYWLR
jgi:hypothetical protein